MNVNVLQDSVQRFRSAMERCHLQLGPTFENFPRGCCGDVSELLAAYLKDEGFGEFTYVSGWSLEKNTSHAWLEGGGYIIDATADQFQERVDCPMVTKNRKWHSKFSDRRQHCANSDFRILDGAEHLLVAYAQLKTCIDRGT